MVSIDSIIPYAQKFAQSPQSENARSNLALRLQLIGSTEDLKVLAKRHFADPHVSVMIWQRIIALNPESPPVLTEAGSVYYMNGYDEMAGESVEKALGLDETYIPAWELKAALCREPGERRQIFDQILKIEPGNRNAVDNLIILGRPIN